MMKLSAPTQGAWIVALIVGIIGILASLVAIPGLSGFALWIIVLAWVILLVTTAIKGA